MRRRIAVMAGRNGARATPRELYAAPANAFVAEFLGVSNRITCTVTDIDGANACAVETSFGVVGLAGPAGTTRGAQGVVTFGPSICACTGAVRGSPTRSGHGCSRCRFTASSPSVTST